MEHAPEQAGQVIDCRAVLLVLLAGPVAAQSRRVVSEFQRYDPFGEVVPVDRTAEPREILSPALARNAFTSFHVIVDIPERDPFFLFVQTNPPDVFQISLYEELFSKTAQGWIPDALQPSKLPAFGTLPYLPLPIPGQKTLCYWLDVRVPPDAAVGRVRLEVLLKAGKGWVMYPMEVRVINAVIPTLHEHPAALPPLAARADASAYGVFRNFVCGGHEPRREERLCVRSLIHRNALQDAALARLLEGKLSRESVVSRIMAPAGGSDRERWCRSPETAEALGAEWYLRVRDVLYRNIP